MPLVLDLSDVEDISDIADNSLDSERNDENTICSEYTNLSDHVVGLTRITGNQTSKEPPRALRLWCKRVGQGTNIWPISRDSWPLPVDPTGWSRVTRVLVRR